MPKRRWRQARYEQRAEHAGNPESGNHPGTVTLKESVRLLTNPHIMTNRREGGGGGGGEGTKACHKQIQCSTQLHVLTELDHNTRQPCKAPYKTPNAHDRPNATEQHWLESNFFITFSHMKTLSQLPVVLKQKFQTFHIVM